MARDEFRGSSLRKSLISSLQRSDAKPQSCLCLREAAEEKNGNKNFGMWTLIKTAFKYLSVFFFVVWTGSRRMLLTTGSQLILISRSQPEIVNFNFDKLPTKELSIWCSVTLLLFRCGKTSESLKTAEGGNVWVLQSLAIIEKTK